MNLFKSIGKGLSDAAKVVGHVASTAAKDLLQIQSIGASVMNFGSPYAVALQNLSSGLTKGGPLGKLNETLLHASSTAAKVSQKLKGLAGPASQVLSVGAEDLPVTFSRMTPEVFFKRRHELRRLGTESLKGLAHHSSAEMRQLGTQAFWAMESALPNIPEARVLLREIERVMYTPDGSRTPLSPPPVVPDALPGHGQVGANHPSVIAAATGVPETVVAQTLDYHNLPATPVTASALAHVESWKSPMLWVGGLLTLGFGGWLFARSRR